MRLNLTSKKYILILFSIITLQTIFLLTAEASLAKHFLLIVLILCIYTILIYCVKLNDVNKIYNPLLWFVAFFAFSYYFPVIYHSLRFSPIRNNIVVDALNENEIIISSIVMFLAVSLGFYLTKKLIPLKDKVNEVLIKNSFIFTVRYYKFIIFISFIISLTRILYFVNGQGGSLEGLTDEQNGSAVGPILNLWTFLYFLIAYIYYNSSKAKKYFILLTIFELGFSTLLGNRRDIIPILSSILIAKAINNKYVISYYKLFFIGIAISFLLSISTVYGYLLAENIDKVRNLNDYIGILLELPKALFSRNDIDYLLLPDAIFGWFDQSFIIAAAIRLYNSGLVSSESGIQYFFLSLMPGINSMGISSSFSYIEYTLFKESLIISSDIPYLTVPSIAAYYLNGGLILVILGSMFSGCLMYLIFRFSMSKNRIHITGLWYFPFMYTLSTFPLQSYLNNAVSYRIKILFLLYFIYFIIRIIIMAKKKI
jgi:hypothetical protein